MVAAPGQTQSGALRGRGQQPAWGHTEIGLRIKVNPVLYEQSHNFSMFASNCIEMCGLVPLIREVNFKIFNAMVQKESHHCDVASCCCIEERGLRVVVDTGEINTHANALSRQGL